MKDGVMIGCMLTFFTIDKMLFGKMKQWRNYHRWYLQPGDPTGTIENGTFKSTVTNNGAIKGGIFQKKPEGVNVASGYTLKVNSQMNGSYDILFATINTLGSSGYVIPNSYYNTSVTIKYSFTYGSSGSTPER